MSDVVVFSFGGASVLRSWFKGADTRAVAVYLERRYNKVISDNPAFEHLSYLMTIHRALKAGNGFMRRLYNSHLFLRKPEAKHVALEGRSLLTQFSLAANAAFALGYCRFKFTPKYHMLSHIVLLLERGSVELPWTLSPISYSCQLDEDLVGRVSKVSTTRSSKLIHEGTIRKYLVNVRLHMYLAN